jgi:type I restriction enzyme R subunit
MQNGNIEMNVIPKIRGSSHYCLHPPEVPVYLPSDQIEIIVEHFRTYTRHKIGGKAKAMVVTNSREHAVRYKLAFDKYLQANNYNDIRSLVAFSVKVEVASLSFSFHKI